MTPTEMQSLFQEQASAFLEASVAASSADLTVLDLQESVNASLMQGMILWRHRLADPTPPLRAVLDVSRRAFRLSQGRSQLWELFDFTPAVFVSILLDGAAPADLLANTCPLKAFSIHGMRYARQAVDSALLSSLLLGRVADELESVLETLSRKRRFRLMVPTYHNHLKLVAAAIANDDVQLRHLAGEGASLYEARARDPGYEPADTEGGGPYNPHAVDYRLAAILHYSASSVASALRAQGFPHVWVSAA